MQKELHTSCCISGGGPAGTMLGFLLARFGVDVIVMEKHLDFFRDFRGDTIHPSTLQILHELGLLDEFLKVPHDEVQELNVAFGDQIFTVADFSHLAVAHPVVGFMPQWDFLNFMAKHAMKYPSYHLMMGTTVTDLIEDNGCVTGVIAKTAEETIIVRSKLVVGADGRHSTVREKSNLPLVNIGAPNDVLWFKLSRRLDDPTQALLNIGKGTILVLINRKVYWQCGYIIAKSTFDTIKQRGLESFGQELTALIGFLNDRVSELKNWDDIKLLDIRIVRLTKWFKPGLLCIGDAAHAMSAIGGVGINLAIQDAVAAAYILTNPLLSNETISLKILKSVQKRREFPTKIIQFFQVFMQNNVISQALDPSKPLRPPYLVKLLNRFPYLRRFPARIIGIGWRLERLKKRNTSYQDR